MKFSIKHLMDDEKITILNSEKELMDFTAIIMGENVDCFHLNNSDDCIHYINEYCGNLQLLHFGDMVNSPRIKKFYEKCKFDGSLRFDPNNTAIYTRDYEGVNFWATIDGNDYGSEVKLYTHGNDIPFVFKMDCNRFDAQKRICKDFELVDTRDWMFKK